jgi:hypothetical protein
MTYAPVLPPGLRRSPPPPAPEPHVEREKYHLRQLEDPTVAPWRIALVMLSAAVGIALFIWTS